MMKKLSIICLSGDFDKTVAALTMTTGAAAVNYEVNLFFTFLGLNIIICWNDLPVCNRIIYVLPLTTGSHYAPVFHDREVLGQIGFIDIH